MQLLFIDAEKKLFQLIQILILLIINLVKVM